MIFDSLRNNSRILIYIVIIAFVGGGVLVGLSGYFNGSNSNAQSQNQTAHAQQQNIAVVNDKPIKYQDFQRGLQRFQQQSQRPIGNSQVLALKNRVLQQMIDQELLLQKAEEENITVNISDQEVETQLDNWIKSTGRSREEIENLLSDRGSSMAQVKKQLKEGMHKQKLINRMVQRAQDGVKVTEKELKDAYEKSTEKEAAGEEFTKIKSKLRKKLKQQKKKQAISQMVNNYREEADIEINSVEIKAYRAAQNENYDEAVAGYKDALDQGNEEAYIYSGLAQVYQQQDKTDKAIETYKKAIEKSPKDSQMKLALGNLYQQAGKEDKAVKQLDKVAESAGDNLLLHYRLQSLYKKMGYEEKAKAEMEKVKELQKKAVEKRKALQKKAKEQQKESKKQESKKQENNK